MENLRWRPEPRGRLDYDPTSWRCGSLACMPRYPGMYLSGKTWGNQKKNTHHQTFNIKTNPTHLQPPTLNFRMPPARTGTTCHILRRGSQLVSFFLHRRLSEQSSAFRKATASRGLVQSARQTTHGRKERRGEGNIRCPVRKVSSYVGIYPCIPCLPYIVWLGRVLQVVTASPKPFLVCPG